MAKHYLVTGGCGFIGSHLVEALARDGAYVTILDNLSTGRRDNLMDDKNLVVGDIRNEATIREIAKDCDGIFHLAAIASVPKSTEQWHSSHTVNLSASIGIFEVAAQLGKPVVYASSSAVYGDVEKTPIAEDDLKRPISAYGADKYAMELHAFAGAETRGLRSFGLRFFNIYGPRQDPASPYSGVIAIFMRNALRGQPVMIHGKGEQVRDFVFVVDAVHALRAAMNRIQSNSSAVSEVSNVCTGEATSIRALVEIVAGLLRPDLEILTGAPRTGDIIKSVGDPSRLQRLLGFKPSIALDEGLRTMIGAAGQTEMSSERK